MNSRIMYLLAGLFLLSAIFSFGIKAASADGTIWGFVEENYDGIYIGGATITTSFGSSTTTDPEGYFSFQHPSGTYSITASAGGYKDATLADVSVVDNDYTELYFHLSPLTVDSNYPSLGVLGPDLAIELRGNGFSEGIRLALMPDSGNVVDIVSQSAPDELNASMSVAMVGSLAYLVDLGYPHPGEKEHSFGRLYVIETANPTSPRLISMLPLPGYGREIEIQGSHAYIVHGYEDDGSGGLFIVDISDPGNLELVGNLPLVLSYGVKVAGDTAYIVGGNCEDGEGITMGGHLHGVNVSSPSSPSVDWSIDLPFCALNLKVDGTLAYVANEWDGLRIVDIEPSSGTFKQTLNVPSSYEQMAWDVEVIDSIAYVAAEDQGLLIYDVADPASPVLIGNSETPGWGRGVTIVDDGTQKTAYIADAISGLSIIDIEIPAAPNYLGTINTDGEVWDVEVSDNLAYAADGGSGLTIIKVSRPQAATLIGSLASNSTSHDIIKEGNIVYLAEELGPTNTEEEGSIKVIDVSDPASPTIISQIKLIDEAPAWGIAKSGTTMYAAAEWGDLQIVDLITESVVRIPLDNNDLNSNSVALNEQFIFVTDGDCVKRIGSGTTGGLNLVDRSNPADSGLHSRADLGGCVIDVKVRDNLAYVTVSDTDGDESIDNGLKIINVDPTVPATFLSTVGSFTDFSSDVEPNGLALDGDYAYVTSSLGELKIIDVSNPVSPQLVGRTEETGYNAWNIQVVGTAAYVSTFYGVHVVDVSDKTHPVFVASVDTPGFAEDLVIEGGRGFVADSFAGLTIVPLPFEFTTRITEIQKDLIRANLPSPAIEGNYIIRAFYSPPDPAVSDLSDSLIGAVSFTSNTVLLDSKAIIVAGGGPLAANSIWVETMAYADQAYRSLLYQGYRHEDIYYLTDQADALHRDGEATIVNLEYALTSWADTSDLLLYFVDHGEEDKFLVRGGTNKMYVTAAELDGWLDTLQTNYPGGKTVFLYDACKSGSFIARQSPPTGEIRISMTSSSPQQVSYFLMDKHSFSAHFWSAFGGSSGDTINLADAYGRAAQTMAGYQTAQLDANGNGVANEADDATALAGAESTIYALRRRYQNRGLDKPVIADIAPDIALSGNSSGSLWAANVYDLDLDNIVRVWAEITPPDYNPDEAGDTVVSLPEVILSGPDSSGVYTGTYGDFSISGTYVVTYYAEDEHGILSLPRIMLVNRTGGTVESVPDAFEDDDAPEQANIIVVNDQTPENRTFHDAGDEDWVQFYGIEGQVYKARAGDPSVICDPVITLYAEDGSTVEKTCNDAGAGFDEECTWTCPADGFYYLRLKNGLSHFGANVYYSLRLYNPIAFSFPGYVEGTITGGGSVIGGAALHGGGGSGISLSNGYYILCLYPGSHSINVSKSGYQSASFGVTILSGVSVIRNVSLTENNRPPTIGGNPPLIAYTNQLYSFRPNSSDPDGDTLSFTATGIPSWASLNGSTGELSGVAGDVDIGTHGPIGITVSDYQYSASLADFSITVLKGSNLPPVISGTIPSKISADRMFRFTPYATDPNGDTLQFSISNKPGWAAFNSGNGSLSGIPGANNIGTHGPVRVAVKDPFGANDSLTFWLVVVPESEIDKYGAIPACYLLLRN